MLMQMQAPVAPTFVGDQAAVGTSEAMTGGSLLSAEVMPEMPGLSAALAAASAAMQAAGESMPAPLSIQHPHDAQVLRLPPLPASCWLELHGIMFRSFVLHVTHETN